MADVAPQRGVDCGADRPLGRAAIPQRDLGDRGVEVVAAQQREAHGEAAGVGEQLVVAEVMVLGRIGDRRGLSQAVARAALPTGPAAPHRGVEELVQGKRQHQVELGAARQERLGEQDVGAAGDRAVAEAGVDLIQLRRDRGRRLVLALGREAPGFARRGDHMAGEMDYPPGGELVEQRVVEVERAADVAQLLARRRARAEIVSMRRHRRGQRHPRGLGLAQGQARLGDGRRSVVGLDARRPGQRLDLGDQTCRDVPGNVALARDEPHGRRVDAGKVCLGALIDSAIGLGRVVRTPRPFIALGQPDQILAEPSAERRDVLVVVLVKPVFGITRQRRLGRPRARQRHHRAVREPFVAGMRVQPAQRRVVGAQHHAPRLETAHQRAPVVEAGRGLVGGGRRVGHRRSFSQSTPALGRASDGGSGSRRNCSRCSLVSCRGTMQRA